MKMMSVLDRNLCDCGLKTAEKCLNACLKRMKGKYGTKDAFSHIDICLKFIDDLITDNKHARKIYQQFRNPPNTPKSRRLGWHKEGEANEQ